MLQILSGVLTPSAKTTDAAADAPFGAKRRQNGLWFVYNKTSPPDFGRPTSCDLHLLLCHRFRERLSNRAPYPFVNNWLLGSPLLPFMVVGGGAGVGRADDGRGEAGRGVVLIRDAISVPIIDCY